MIGRRGNHHRREPKEPQRLQPWQLGHDGHLSDHVAINEMLNQLSRDLRNLWFVVGGLLIAAGLALVLLLLWR